MRQIGVALRIRFLLDPARTAELLRQAPPNWDRLNLEAVIRTQILDNHAGPAALVDVTFWWLCLGPIGAIANLSNFM
jgi:hypothetical protein